MSDTSREEKKYGLYSMLGLEKGASAADIKKAYRIMALKVHPDKNPDDEQAKERFQHLQTAYKVLSDPEKKAVYDETGFTGEEESASFAEAYVHYRRMYRKITREDIESFAKSYKGSDSEKEDLINFYERFEGDVKHLLQCIPLSELEDVTRLLDWLTELRDSGDIEAYPAFTKSAERLKSKTEKELLKMKSTKRKKKSPTDDMDADPQTGSGSMDALVLAIQAKHQQRGGEDFLSALEKKYSKVEKKSSSKSGAGKKSKRSRAEAEQTQEIDDAEFERIQAEMMERASKSKGKTKAR